MAEMVLEVVFWYMKGKKIVKALNQPILDKFCAILGVFRVWSLEKVA